MRNLRQVQTHIPYAALLENFDRVLAERINPEVYLDGEALDTARSEDLRRIHTEFTKANLSITMHGPYTNINPGAADEKKRLEAARVYEKAFDAAAYLRPKNIVLHPGYHERTFHGDVKLWLSQSMKTWPVFVKRAEEIGVTIAAENIFDKTPFALSSLMDAIGSPNFRICIDTGHLNVFSSVPMEDWFRSLGAFIAEMHLHDNSGNADDHLPLGEGSIDFDRVFDFLDKYSKTPVYTIEPHGEDVMRRSLKAVQKYL